MSYGLILLVLGVLALWLYVRYTPAPEARFAERPGPMEVGEHPATGGVKWVLARDGLPEDALDRISDLVAKGARTQLVAEAAENRVYIVRSAIWGFPDVVVIWQTEDALHIHSHLVYGVADLGVNSARVGGWLDALGWR